MGSFCEFDRSSTVSKLKVSRIREKESNRNLGIVTRKRSGKFEGIKRILEIHPELESLIIKLNKNGLSLRKISFHLKDELGYDVSFISVRNILNDIDWMKKDEKKDEKDGGSDMKKFCMIVKTESYCGITLMVDDDFDEDYNSLVLKKVLKDFLKESRRPIFPERDEIDMIKEGSEIKI